jgi:transcriptional regulator with XRE-family HTH domain
MKNRVVYGEKYRALRVQTGAGMREVAAAAGCSWRHLQMIETYKRQPGPELTYRLAHVLSRLAGRTVHVDEFSAPVDNEAAA